MPLAVSDSFTRIALGCFRSASFDTGVHAPVFASMRNCPQMLSLPPLGCCRTAFVVALSPALPTAAPVTPKSSPMAES